MRDHLRLFTPSITIGIWQGLWLDDGQPDSAYGFLAGPWYEMRAEGSWFDVPGSSLCLSSGASRGAHDTCSAAGRSARLFKNAHPAGQSERSVSAVGTT